MMELLPLKVYHFILNINACLLFQGAATYGGGGAGGRIAIYHTHINHYEGDFIVHGGKGYNQWGGSGTIYIEDQHEQPSKKYLTTDNGGFQVHIVFKF